MAKKAEVTRVRMTDAEVEKFLAHYAKQRDLKPGKEFNDAVRRCAATRWAALERNASKAAKAKPKGKAAKKGAAK